MNSDHGFAQMGVTDTGGSPSCKVSGRIDGCGLTFIVNARVASMNLHEKIVMAFEGHPLLHSALEKNKPVGTDEQDALQFTGRQWGTLTRAEWEHHFGALHAFSPEAFIYCLPTVLTFSHNSPREWFWAADVVLGVLDRSPMVGYWDEFIARRLIGFDQNEYDVLREWLVDLSSNTETYPGRALERAFDTVGLLGHETNGLRATISHAGKQIKDDASVPSPRMASRNASRTTAPHRPMQTSAQHGRSAPVNSQIQTDKAPMT